MSRRQLRCFGWNGVRWNPVDNHSEQLNSHQSLNISSSHEPIRLATWNILADTFPWYIQMAIRSAERYEWLCNGISTLNPTIIGLNEVSITALRLLQQSTFIRDNYFITECLDETNNESDQNDTERCLNGLCSPHGTIILSKLPLLDVFAVRLVRSTREAIIIRVLLGHQQVHICALHLKSLQMPWVAQVRAQQMHDILKSLHSAGYPFVVMGDLNLHHLSEDSIVVNNQLIDAWVQTHFSSRAPFNDGAPGFTFDAIKNTFIPYYSPGDYRQMRLDRILFSQGFPGYAINPCILWANELIKPESYLFPSDHFGLSIDFITDTINNDNETLMFLGQPDPTADEILHQNAENQIDQNPRRFVLLRRMGAYTAHLGWLGAVALGFKQ